MAGWLSQGSGAGHVSPMGAERASILLTEALNDCASIFAGVGWRERVCECSFALLAKLQSYPVGIECQGICPTLRPCSACHKAASYKVFTQPHSLPHPPSLRPRPPACRRTARRSPESSTLHLDSCWQRSSDRRARSPGLFTFTGSKGHRLCSASPSYLTTTPTPIIIRRSLFLPS